MSSENLLSQLNNFVDIQFVELLGGIYEHSPWVAEQVYQQRPFDSIKSLEYAMAAIVTGSSRHRRLTLICNHPQLAGKEAEEGALTQHSTREQKGAGLDQCSSEELAKIQALNKQYMEKFEFPFVIAVSGLNRYQIIEAMQQRLHNNPETEFDTSINEIVKIASIRLKALLDG